MNDVRRASQTFPDVLIERFVLGELPPAQIEAMRQALGADAGLAQRVNALNEGDTEWLAAAVRPRVNATGERGTHPLRWLAPLAAAMIVAAVVAGPWFTPESSDRIKGPDALLAIYRQTPVGSEQLHDGDRARPGDVIRIGYKVSATGFGVIVSVDGRGLVTLHHPGSGQIAAPLRDGEMILLNQAYELDDAPERERFFIVTGSRPFDVEQIVSEIRRQAAAHDLAILRLPDNLEQSSFLLQKDSRP